MHGSRSWASLIVAFSRWTLKVKKQERLSHETASPSGCALRRLEYPAEECTRKPRSGGDADAEASEGRLKTCIIGLISNMSSDMSSNIISNMDLDYFLTTEIEAVDRINVGCLCTCRAMKKMLSPMLRKPGGRPHSHHALLQGRAPLHCGAAGQLN